jgi:hypothetical protein
MNLQLPLERFSNTFDKQFLAMRYLLLGLMESRPEYKHALAALESATPYVQAYSATKQVNVHYQEKLLRALDLYPTLGSTGDSVEHLKRLLTPDFEQNPVPVSESILDDDDTLEAQDASVPTLSRVTGEFDKLFISMQYFLLGLMVYEPKYQVAYDALLYASEIHVGFRKDGKTPEFQHQLEIAHLIRTMLRGLIYPAETLASIFLHDTPEDYDVQYAEIKRRFGEMVANATSLLNKYDEQGNPKPLDDYYSALAYDPIASVAKPGDNGHNQSTMADVFSYKKQFEYSLNIKNRSWNMMKVARRMWPEQEAVYENLKFLLRVQYNAVQAMLGALKFDPVTGKIHPALQS